MYIVHNTTVAFNIPFTGTTYSVQCTLTRHLYIYYLYLVVSISCKLCKIIYILYVHTFSECVRELASELARHVSKYGMALPL